MISREEVIHWSGVRHLDETPPAAHGTRFRPAVLFDVRETETRHPESVWLGATPNS